MKEYAAVCGKAIWNLVTWLEFLFFLTFMHTHIHAHKKTRKHTNSQAHVKETKWVEYLILSLFIFRLLRNIYWSPFSKLSLKKSFFHVKELKVKGYM